MRILFITLDTHILLIDNPSERQQLYKLQEKAVKELKQHLIKECNNEHRIAILLLRLPALRSLQPNIIEEIFFSSLLGSFQIDAVIPQILKLKCSNTGKYIIIYNTLYIHTFTYHLLHLICIFIDITNVK